MAKYNVVNAYRLDPGDFPKRIELILSNEIVEKISATAEKTGRSFSEVATDILAKDITQ